MNINKHSIYKALSYLIDVFEGNYLAHAKHVAYTSALIGKQLGFDSQRLENLYYVALLHDIGASTTYGVEEHSLSGEKSLAKLGYDQKSQEIIRYHHEGINGSGPFSLKEDKIPVESLIIYQANLIDFFLKEFDAPSYDIRIKLNEHLVKGKNLFPTYLIEAATQVSNTHFFLLDYYSSNIDINSKRHLDFLEDRSLNFEEVKTFANLFADVVDLRNPFTFDHSNGIADKMLEVTKALNYDQETIDKAHLAALLHDVGKVFVSNDILDKNGPLEAHERYEINKHTYYTRWILSMIEGFEDIVEWSSNHHEKLDGSGYPYGLEASELDELSRILAIVDIYQALTEERPYRKPMSEERTWSILFEMADEGKLDKNLTNRLKDILGK